MRLTNRIGTWLACTALACGAPSPKAESPERDDPKPTSTATAPVAPVTPPPPSIVQLRTGRIDPLEIKEPVTGTVEAHAVRDGWELVVAQLPAGWRSTAFPNHEDHDLWGGNEQWLSQVIVHVAVPGAEAALNFALLNDSDPTPQQMKSSVGPPPPKDLLWLKRPVASAGRPLDVTLYTSISSRTPGSIVRVQLPAYDQLPSATDLDVRYTRALARYIQNLPDSPFRSFALTSLRRAARGTLPDVLEPERYGAWEDLMDLGTGRRSIDLALQTNSPLRARATERPTIPISKLKPPELNIPPYEQMLAQLGTAVPAEPLANTTPADFYFARSKNIEALFDVLDEVDSWVTPAVHVLDTKMQRLDLAARYQTQLGLRRTELSRRLGPELISELAVIGSDPFMRDGSDVTVLFRPRSDTALATALTATVQLTARPHGGIESKELRAAGHPVVFSWSPNRAVAQYKANVAGLLVVSNSLGAITRVIETSQGKHPALSSEPDFRYMLARDATVPADVLAFAGDRFMQSAVSPISRVLDARRQVAKSELLRVSHAALLFGWLHGNPATSGEQLVKSVVFSEAEMRHFDRERITFDSGSTRIGPRSAWGSPASLTPLIDLAAPTRVTTTEKSAYEAFVRRYQGVWAEALDPIALRVRIQHSADGTALGAKLRVVPIARDTDMMQMARIVGDGRVHPGPVASGFRLLLALAKDSELRRELSGQSRSMLGRTLAVDWIGPYAMVGVLDDPSLPNAMSRSDWVSQKPADDEEHHSKFEWVFDVPLYAALSIESSKGAALALAVLKERLGNFGTWTAATPYREQAITEIAVEGEHLSLFYALTDKLLIVTLSEKALHHLIDLVADGKPLPKGSTARDPDSAQWAFDLSGVPGGGLWTAMTWAIARELERADNDNFAQARQLFYGVPDTASDPQRYDAVALAYLGAIPVTQDGKRFTLTRAGVSDPVRGNDHAPVWPELPVPGSDLDRVLQTLQSVRSAISFDTEPSGGSTTPQRSLSVTLEAKRSSAPPGKGDD